MSLSLIDPETRFAIVRVADSERARTAVYRFRHTVMVNERGWVDVAGIDPFDEQVNTDEDEAEGVSHLYSGSLYGGELDSTARLRIWKPGEVPSQRRAALELARLPGLAQACVAELDMIVAHPELGSRDHLPVAALFRAAFDLILEAGAQALFFTVHPGLAAAAGRVFGARRYGAKVRQELDGPAVPMVIIPSDTAYLERAGALFVASAWKHFVLARRPRVDLTPFVDELVDELASPMPEDARWSTYEERFYRRGVQRWSFFDGLRDGVVEELLARGEGQVYDVGEALFEQGDSSQQMYIVLEGCFEIFVNARSVDVASEGELIGEIAMLSSPEDGRSASAKALIPSKVIALDGAALKALTFGDPEAGHQVMVNLARFVAERFHERVKVGLRLERELDELRDES
ncbi:cyclic nucleotide-binding protein [Plesiocystis pacifica SIR-1]|uniref:Cyclic nucleotide-binding protein n=1 Tax=Plesiocystis pacifica SIR-1 TaxID=391625 RepID=A6GEW3_9BACT|nr:cyclic nucleotide-binding domain-containing protein [Plesiocystis pacifica]EDM75625.1 cyclic nucleotide-binding protein [Plesiocystis pacifica SIR-1]